MRPETLSEILGTKPDLDMDEFKELVGLLPRQDIEAYIERLEALRPCSFPTGRDPNLQ